jgi:hypothetical protein
VGLTLGTKDKRERVVAEGLAFVKGETGTVVIKV